MALPVDTIIEVACIGRLNQQTTMNIWHYVVDVPSSLPNNFDELNELLNVHFGGLANSIGGTLMECCPQNWSFTQATAQSIYPSRQRRVIQARQFVGTRGLAEQPNVQASITYQTDLAGRAQIGGKRIPMTPLDSAAGIIVVGLKGPLELLGQRTSVFISGGAAGGSYSPVIYHRSPNANPKYHRITDWIVQDQTRVIRRRTVGLGI